MQFCVYNLYATTYSAKRGVESADGIDDSTSNFSEDHAERLCCDLALRAFIHTRVTFSPHI